MIPKKIHFCWFGDKPIPQEQQQFIETWKKLMPDYEFFFWNEQNQYMHLPYMQTAHKNRKWANLSNFLRLQVIYEHGGIYLDTDVKVVKRFDPLLTYECFLGFESRKGERISINNAIFGAIPNHPFIKECKTHLLSHYEGSERAHESSPRMITKLLKEKGLKRYGDQTLEGVTLLTNDYFYPYQWNEQFAKEFLTDNTYAIHFWSKSWHEKKKQSKYLQKRSEFRRRLLQFVPILASLNRLLQIYREFGEVGLRLYSEGKVQLGPFQGMKYHALRIKGTNSFPKLIGSFEHCLHPAIYSLIDNQYNKIINVQCTEGYFAMGLARIFENATVTGYDVNPDAIRIANKNCVLNALEERVTFKNLSYGHKDLLNEDFTENTLFLCTEVTSDLDFFQPAYAKIFQNVDVLLKIADFVDARTKHKIQEIFSGTHHVEVYPKTPLPPIVSAFLNQNLQTRQFLRLLDEGEQDLVEWILLRSKKRGEN